VERSHLSRPPTKLLYVHAFVDAVVVPLPYLLTRRLMRQIFALGVAGIAGIVTLDDSLTDHTGQIYTDRAVHPLEPPSIPSVSSALPGPPRLARLHGTHTIFLRGWCLCQSHGKARGCHF